MRWRRTHGDLSCKDLRVVHADAAAFEPPANGNIVVYLYNPFGKATLERVVQRLLEREDGRCFVLYHTPVDRTSSTNGRVANCLPT